MTANDLILFSAQWCGPCRASKPNLDAFLEENPGVGLNTMDVDDHQDKVAEYKVLSVPTLVAVDADGVEVGRHVGAYSKSILERLVDVQAAPAL